MSTIYNLLTITNNGMYDVSLIIIIISEFIKDFQALNNLNFLNIDIYLEYINNCMNKFFKVKQYSILITNYIYLKLYRLALNKLNDLDDLDDLNTKLNNYELSLLNTYAAKTESDLSENDQELFNEIAYLIAYIELLNKAVEQEQAQEQQQQQIQPSQQAQQPQPTLQVPQQSQPQPQPQPPPTLQVPQPSQPQLPPTLQAQPPPPPPPSQTRVQQAQLQQAQVQQIRQNLLTQAQILLTQEQQKQQVVASSVDTIDEAILDHNSLTQEQQIQQVVASSVDTIEEVILDHNSLTDSNIDQIKKVIQQLNSVLQTKEKAVKKILLQKSIDNTIIIYEIYKIILKIQNGNLYKKITILSQPKDKMQFNIISNKNDDNKDRIFAYFIINSIHKADLGINEIIPMKQLLGGSRLKKSPNIISKNNVKSKKVSKKNSKKSKKNSKKSKKVSKKV